MDDYFHKLWKSYGREEMKIASNDVVLDAA